jgi:uncharacterized protein YndB with AHSA1/START domain
MTDSAASTHSLVIERDLPHPPGKVWRALTQSNLIQQWLMENDFEPTLGHKFSLRTAPVPGWNGIIDGEVLAVEPERLLSYTWASMGLASKVTFTLTATAAGTQLRMEQSGFPDTESNYYKGAKYGWQNFLGKLDHVVAGLA